jgi:RNA polymerase sigma-70 factor (ECF subfamily)
VAEAREAALPAAVGPVGAPGRAATSERALVRAAQGGSAAAMEELFRRHWPRAHRAAWLVVHDAAAAEDVAQEAFLAAVRSLHRFDRRRPFGPCLHRIVVNRAIDYARAREVRREVLAEAVAEAAGDSWSSSSEAPSDEVVAALAALAPEQRAVIVLRRRSRAARGCARRRDWRSPPLPRGRMLVTSPRGARIVAEDGSRTLLGTCTGAAWAPRGRYVAAWRGADLSAVAPDGRVAWTVRAPGPVAAAWSPDGYRVPTGARAASGSRRATGRRRGCSRRPSRPPAPRGGRARRTRSRGSTRAAA